MFAKNIRIIHYMYVHLKNKLILACNFLAILVITRLTGISKSNTAKPAKVEGPITSNRKYNVIKITRGEDHRTLM